MHKLKYILVLVVIIASSCSSLRFDRYAGKALETFPEEYRGKYINTDISLNDTDTLILYISSNSYSLIDNKQTNIDFLDDKHVFSVYKKQHYIFINENDYWSGFAVNKKENKISMVPLTGPLKNDTIRDAKILKRYFQEVQVIKGVNNLEKASYAVKMNEDKLLKYTKRIKKHKVVFTQVQE